MDRLHRSASQLNATVVIVEDEPLIAARLARLTREIEPDDTTTIERAGDLQQARILLAARPRSILLLDLNLSGEDGFGLLRQAIAQPCQTIVVSANTDRAMEAFELGVADFVAKPFTRERLATALQRARERLDGERIRYLAVTLAGKMELIPLDTVVAIHGDDDYARVETLDGRKHLHRKTLNALIETLPQNFRRVHRSHIVNMTHVVRIVTNEGGKRTVLLPNGASVPFGRSYIAGLANDSVL